MFSNSVIPHHHVKLLILYTTLSISEGQLEGTTPRQSLVTLNPCEYYNSRYSYAIIDCVWQDLPSNMLARYNPRFKELVRLDDDGVFKLLCQSIEQRGDLLLEAFANDYTNENEKKLFLDVVDSCHAQVMDASDHVELNDARTTVRPQARLASGMSSNKDMVDTRTIPKASRFTQRDMKRRSATDSSHSMDAPH